MNIGGMIQTWSDVLTNPGEAIFQTESDKEQAKLSTALIWIIVSAVIVALLGFLQRRLLFGPANFGSMVEQMNLPPEYAEQARALLESGALEGITSGVGLASAVVSPILFLIGVGIYHLIARVLGGRGEYGKYAYLVAAYQAPIAILVAILAFVPWIGGCFGAVVSIYGLVLTYFATKVNYQLTSGKAIAVVVLPIVIFMALAGCAAVATVTALVAGFN